MHIGISRPPASPRPIPDVDAAIIVKAAEEADFESMFYGEHPFQLIAKYADGWILAMLGETRMKEGVARVRQGMDLLDRLCNEIGRDRAEMRITALLGRRFTTR